MRYPDPAYLLPIPLAVGQNCSWKHAGGFMLEAEESETVITKKEMEAASPIVDRARELRAELARKIASYMGSAENRAT
jgi:hypothetical protein